MFKRVRKFIRATFLGLGLLAMSATPAAAHTQEGYGGWWVWQGSRSVFMFVGGTLVGEAKVETTYRDLDIYNRLHGFNAWHVVADYTNNGPNDCVEAWMDFNGTSRHRNPTVLRHCNINGDVYGDHYYITDPALFTGAPSGWDFAVCRAVKDGFGAWRRSECTNELGHKPQAWVQDNFGAPATDQSNSGCVSNYIDARYEWGCKMYRHDI